MKEPRWSAASRWTRMPVTIQVPADVPGARACIPDVPWPQFSAIASTELPGARKRMSKYVCVERFVPVNVAVIEFPARTFGGSKATVVAMGSEIRVGGL